MLPMQTVFKTMVVSGLVLLLSGCLHGERDDYRGSTFESQDRSWGRASELETLDGSPAP